MKRALMLAAALAIPVSGVAVVGLSGPASAAAKPPKVTILCTTITGNITANIVVSGCTGGDTGGSSTPLPAVSLAIGGTITWVSGATTTIGAPTLSPTSAKHCAGYNKNTPLTNPTAEKFSATVIAGSDVNTPPNMPLTGSSKGEVCLYPDNSISAPKVMKTKGRS
jgi:hypothetical protein